MPHCPKNNLVRVANSFFLFLCIHGKSKSKTIEYFLANHFPESSPEQIHWFLRHIGEI